MKSANKMIVLTYLERSVLVTICGCDKCCQNSSAFIYLSAHISCVCRRSRGLMSVINYKYNQIYRTQWCQIKLWVIHPLERFAVWDKEDWGDRLFAECNLLFIMMSSSMKISWNLHTNSTEPKIVLNSIHS